MKCNLVKKHPIGLAAAALLALAGCPQIDPPAPVPTQTDFAAFVKDLLAKTADNAGPVEIDAIDFAFPADTDFAAFDPLFVTEQ